jgi:hypothetical protein
VYPKVPDWPPGARTANGTALCHKVQLYIYFVSQSSVCFAAITLYVASQRVFTVVKRIFLYRMTAETFGYSPVKLHYLNVTATTRFVGPEVCAKGKQASRVIPGTPCVSCGHRFLLSVYGTVLCKYLFVLLLSMCCIYVQYNRLRQVHCAYIHITKKVKLPLCSTKHHAMKAYWGSGGIAPLILWPRH